MIRLPTDLVIAVGLIAIVVVLLFLFKIGIVSKKSLPYVGGGLAALFGLFLYTRSRRNREDAATKAEQDRLDALQRKANEEGRDVRTQVGLWAEARSALERRREATDKMTAANAARRREDREAILGLRGEDLHARADEVATGLLAERGGQ